MRPRTKHHDLPIRLRKVGPYYYWYGRVDGKRKSVALGKDRAAALARWAELEGAGGGATVGDAIDSFIVRTLPKYRKKTREEYARQLERLRRVFGHMHLRGVKAAHIYGYLEARAAKIAANREVTLLAQVFEHARRRGWLELNPCTGVHRHPEHARDRYISDDELEALKDAAGSDHMRAAIELAYLTALRKGDLLTLRLSQLSERGIELRQSKRGARQRIKWSPALRAVVDTLKSSRGAQVRATLIARRNGEPYTSNGFNAIWRRTKERAGLMDVTFHDIRGKALTDAKEKAGLEYAKALAGHENVSTTEGYVSGRETVEVMPLR